MDYPEIDYYLNESSSDVIFVVDGHRLPAIKSILSLKSPVFRSLLSGMSETKESKLPETVIKDTTVDAFKTLIRFIYTEVLLFKDDNDLDHICDVYELSDRYEILRLRQRVVNHFEFKISNYRVIYEKLKEISKVFFQQKFEELMAKVMTIIESNIKKLIRIYVFNHINELISKAMTSNDQNINQLIQRLIETNNTEEFIEEMSDFIVNKYQDLMATEMANEFKELNDSTNGRLLELMKKPLEGKDYSGNEFITKDMDFLEVDYFLNESLSDVLFIVDGQRMPAIKSMLKLKSRVFRAMFSGNFCETNVKEIEIKDTTVDAFKTMIRFLYTEQLVIKDDNDLDHICDVFQLSDRYEVLRLRQKLFTLFESGINLSDVLSIGSVVFAHNIEELKAKVMTFIELNINELIQTDVNGLKELNDLTDNKLLDVMTTKLLDSNNNTIYLMYGMPPILYYINTEGITSETFKTFISLLYFHKLILKDDEDLELIREVCRLCDTHHNFSHLLALIGTHLEEGITFENLESISRIAFDYRIDGLIEKVNEMKA